MQGETKPLVEERKVQAAEQRAVQEEGAGDVKPLGHGKKVYTSGKGRSRSPRLRRHLLTFYPFVWQATYHLANYHGRLPRQSV